MGLAPGRLSPIGGSNDLGLYGGVLVGGGELFPLKNVLPYGCRFCQAIMSKINPNTLQIAVQSILTESHNDKSGKPVRKFPESVDLQVPKQPEKYEFPLF